MKYVKLLVLAIAALLVLSTLAFSLSVDGQGNIRTQITLGLKKEIGGEARGDPDNALPTLVRVGETHLVYGRIMQLPDGKNFQPFPNAAVKLIDVFNNAQNPIVLATARSDNDGFFVFEWKVSAKEFKKFGIFKLQEGITSTENLRLQILAVYDGDANYAKATSRGYIVQLKPLRLDVSIQTDKKLYVVGESAHVTITLKDLMGNLTDPDELEVFFGASRVSPVHQAVGTYFFTSSPLTENIHKVTVLFDKEEYLREIISVTITASTRADLPIDLQVRLDQKEYGLGDFIIISGTAKPVVEGKVVLINVNNPNGAIYNFGHVVPNVDGTFSQRFALVGPLAITGEWKATVTYMGSQLTESFNVKELLPKLPRVTVRSTFTINDKGEALDRGLSGMPLGIQTEIANGEKEDMALTYIVQVKDAEGFTVMISWIRGIVLKPDTSIRPAIFWVPEIQGNYNIDIFVWKSLEEPVPLSTQKTLKVSVT
ncbi:MAG: hypothetical protein QXU32_13140 [Nitrososphaerales archaeon]